MAEEANKTDKKKSDFSIRKLIYNDKYLIIISIVLAVVIWIATAMNLSPQTSKTISVPVTVDFTDSAAEQLGIKCYGDETVDVDVTVTCKKYLAKDISADDLNVYLQTNTVTTKGNAEVPIKVESNDSADFEVVSYYPTVYKAYFDVEDEKVMDINVNYTNNDFVADGYIMGEPLLSTTSVTVKGAKSYVSQVSKVVSTVNFINKINSSETVDLVLSAIDNYGSPVDYVSVETETENLTLTIPVFKSTVLDVSAALTGKPAGINASDFSISYSVNRINAGVLEEANIIKANVGNIDFSKLTVGDNEFKIKTSTLDSILVLDDIDEIIVKVNVPDSYSTETMGISADNVDISNIPKGYNVKVSRVNASDVTIVGNPSDLEDLSPSNVVLILDMATYKKEIKEGVQTFNVTASIENSDKCWVYGTYTVDVNITKE